MKRSANVILGSLAAFLLIFMVKPTLAGKSSVYVESNVESYSSNQTNSKTKTDIKIESNGEVKEYHSEDDGNVTLESSDGNSKVKINNQTGSQTKNSQSSSSSVKTNINVNTNDSTNSSDAKETVKEKIKEIQKIKFNLLEFIKYKLAFIFKFSFFK